jgi:hypothetical protein
MFDFLLVEPDALHGARRACDQGALMAEPERRDPHVARALAELFPPTLEVKLQVAGADGVFHEPSASSWGQSDFFGLGEADTGSYALMSEAHELTADALARAVEQIANTPASPAANTIMLSPRAFREVASIGLLPGETILFNDPASHRIRAVIRARWARKAQRGRERYAKRKRTDWWGRPL